ncbi:MAG: class I tRNA ligase family protein, partial [Candidatus Margulisbacteria bacterium]|nr:class I tRNA ligase family protein [Candidatus Margulisiibacteriota bacterium]
KKAIEVVKEKKIEFIPERWTKVYLDWMENIQDWCISRQIWWGHRIPVWYCECGEQIVSRNDPKECPKCKKSNLKQDEDVLDTWFSSALWPFSTLGWPEQTADLKKYYPTSDLVTGYDIIFFWVARMITMGTKFMNNVPFKRVLIHGLIRDTEGRKMSKSAGNAVDPIETINKYGTDSLRFTLTSLVTAGGQDLKLSEEKLNTSRNFMNKIWNLTRFYLTQKDKIAYTEETFADQWIQSRFQSVLKKINSLLEEASYGEAANLLYDFTWSEFCDWYVEMFKLGGSKNIFLKTLLNLLQILHPFIPFITEELWARLDHDIIDKTDSIMLSHWPKLDESIIDKSLEKRMSLYIELIRAVRNLRAEMNIPQSKKVDLIILAKNEEDFQDILQGDAYIKTLAKIHKIDLLKNLAFKPREASTAVVNGGIEIYMPLANLINIEVEVARLKKEISKIDADIMRVKNKLANSAFTSKAPMEVIQKEKDKEKSFVEKRKILADQISALTKAQ